MLSFKGAEGKVIKVMPSRTEFMKENIKKKRKKHTKPNANNKRGNKQDAPIHISNVMLVDPHL